MNISVLNKKGEVVQVEIQQHTDEKNRMYFTIDPRAVLNDYIHINKHSL